MIAEEKINEAISTNEKAFLENLRTIMQIPSVKGSSEKDAPFGKGPKKALETIVPIIERCGFKAKVVNNAMAYAQWGDDDENYIGIIDHLDVVPVGDKWKFNPWDLSDENGRLYGRGILDNKGPALATLWAMKILKDLGYRPKRTIRLVFGSDEENGSKDVPLYLEKEKPPIFGWTGDCKYPVVYGERGIVNYSIFTLILDGSLSQIKNLQGDMSKDHVPDELSIEIKNKKVESHGIRVPSNAPEMGKNAITYLAKKIVDENLVSGQLNNYFKWIVKALHQKHYGEGLGIEFHDNDSGKLIMTPTGLNIENNGMRIEIAIRYPVSYQEKQITAGIKNNIPVDSNIKVIRSIPSVMHDKNSKFIQILSEVYEKVTGLDGTPVTTTGATYARVMPNIIAFGPSFPGQKGIAHKENEWMDLDDLLLSIKIYMRSLERLGSLE